MNNLNRAQAYRQALRDQWKELVMPSNGATFIVGQIDTTALVRFQGMGQAVGLDTMTEEELKGLKEGTQDPEVQAEMVEKVRESGMSLADMMDILIPAMVKEPKIEGGNRPDEAPDNVLYVGELDPRDTLFLVDYVMKELKLEELAYFR